MLNGKFRQQDSAGDEGVLTVGSVHNTVKMLLLGFFLNNNYKMYIKDTIVEIKT